MAKLKLVHVKAHTRKAPKKKKGTFNKYGIKQNLTKREITDRNRLKMIMETARKEHKKYSGKRDKASRDKTWDAFDNFWDASEKMYERYGVEYPALGD